MSLSNEEMVKLARELPIDGPWDRELFIKRLAQQRGRPIRLIATDTANLTDTPCGLWVVLDDEDVILHEAGTSEYHIDQIICHEIGHMVLGHDRSRSGDPHDDESPEIQLYRRLLPDIDPETVLAVLGRMDYESDQEREAETFASLLMIAVAEASDQKSMIRTVFFPDRDR